MRIEPSLSRFLCWHGLAAALALSTFAAQPAWAQATQHSAEAKPAAPHATQSGGDGQPAGVVNLNSASEEELSRLPGVGPARARAIVELRTKLQRFKRIEDLMRVKGIGRKTFRKLRPMLTLQGPTTLEKRVTQAK